MILGLKWIKHKLQEQLKDEIVITEINGKPNFVTFRTTAAKILQNFYSEQRCSDPTGQKKRIILAAAKLLKTKIKEMNCCSESYPNNDKVGSLEFCKQLSQRSCVCFWKICSFQQTRI